MSGLEIGGIRYMETQIGKNKKPVYISKDRLTLGPANDGIIPYRDDPKTDFSWISVRKAIENRNLGERLMNNEEWAAQLSSKKYAQSRGVWECIDALVNFSGKYPVLWEGPEIEKDGYNYKLKRTSGRKKTVRWLPRAGRFEYYKIIRFDEETMLPIEIEIDPERISVGDACGSIPPGFMERAGQEYNKPSFGSYISAKNGVKCLVRRGSDMDLTYSPWDYLDGPGFKLVVSK